ncbi:microtubule-associated tumor suppressor 1 homolog A isoform X2 [Brachyistius frenatus]|uniref:microtubule-associated tumor suppressor 1 homolog A isoform X2 n=1 Tax=Brachyistius frenatus TaxID=100188 RepID=UPI0037E8A48E
MSNETFNLSTDHVESTVPLACRGLQLLPLSPENDSNSSMSASPESNSIISYQSDTEASSSPDINLLECCNNECPPVDNLCDTTLTQGDVSCGATTNLNQTFLATPVNGSRNFWNESLSLMSNEDAGSEKDQTFKNHIEDESNSEVMSPDSVGRDSQLSSYEVSCRGSIEDECFSVSSGEKVMRSNSFCLEDESLLVMSSMDEPSISPAAGHPASPGESKRMSVEDNTGNTCFGVTFTQGDNWEPLPEENDKATANSLIALPSENEAKLSMTFICETSPDCVKGNTFASGETVLLPNRSEAITPEEGKVFVSALSAIQESNKDIYTSTPVQNSGNKIPSLLSFSESPCIGNGSNPGLPSVNRQQISVTPKQHLVAVVPTSASKIKKIEIKKYPKSDFSTVKAKVITRAPHSLMVPGSGMTFISAATKVLNESRQPVNTRAANLGVTMNQSCERPAADGEDKSRASPPDHHLAANDQASAVQCSKDSSETEQAASSQVSDASAQHAGSQTLCLSSLEKSLGRIGQIDLKPAPKKVESKKIEVRSALGQNKPPVHKTRPISLSESSSSTSRPSKEKRTTIRFSTSFTTPKADNVQVQPKAGNLNCSSQKKRAIKAEETNGPTENCSRDVRKISLLGDSSRTTVGAPREDSKSRFQVRPSPRKARVASLSQPPTASPRTTTLSPRLRRETLVRDDWRTFKAVGTPQSKQKSNTGSHSGQATGEPSLGAASGASVKPQLNGRRPPHTPTHPSLMGPPLTPACRQPRKALGPSRALTEANALSVCTRELGQGTGNTQVSGGAAHKPSPFKSVVLKARLIATPGKNTGPTLTPSCKSAASTSRGASNSTVSPLKRAASARLRPTSGGPVNKNKSKASSCQQQASQPNQTNGPAGVVPAGVTQRETKENNIGQLEGLLTSSNCRFEAVAIVLQQTLAARDEATRQCRELSQELVNLQGELVCSVHSSDRLEKEKEDLRVALEDALHKLQEQHQKDQAELELRLQAFYQAEWDKVHVTYQQEADKCRTLMQQQMGELKASHEAVKLEVESSHVEQLQCVKQQYEVSLEELKEAHSQELQSLDQSLKDAESALSGQIQAMTVEKNILMEKLTAEKNRRREMADKSQKDSHMLYLEQELESLKVVLEIKNKQLHQQEKKLMEIDKLTEKTVKLDESLKKVQQENEDFKARMERHAALSRQLSTEQAVLQESLHKESKVNKRLSMENEELMWKLHNGDLSSPRKVSPTSPSASPSHSFSLQSPRSSDVFSSPPVSPR